MKNKQTQMQAHLNQKKQLAEGKLKDTAIIVQDFSALDTTKKCQNNQDLIIVIYKHDPLSPDGLSREYIHYVGEKTTKNNVDFVISTWEHLKLDKSLLNINKIHMWSDGGPKHFKLSASMFYFSLFSQHINTTYHFFESYHGQSACDAAASHAKRRINVLARDDRKIMEHASTLSEAINTVRCHRATPVILLTSLKTTKFPTMNGNHFVVVVVVVCVCVCVCVHVCVCACGVCVICVCDVCVMCV